MSKKNCNFARQEGSSALCCMSFLSVMEIEKLISHKYPGREVLYLVDKALGVQLPDMLVLTVSESIKTLATVQTIWDWLLDHHATRRTLLVCVGGGVITDLGGFAAATYRRGIDYINVPTTLLAMVDAAVGGKTGFDYRGLKNSIGVIREPLETIILPEWLQTLPDKDVLSGYAELIKTALLDNNVMDLTALLKDDLRNWEPYITQAVEVKKRIVAEDPTEQGLRKVLNLGHTIGHALEELTIHQFTDSSIHHLPHGFAVMYGLVAELYLSVVLLGLDKQVLQQITHVMMENYGRPVCSCKDYDRLIELMHDDKKNEQEGQINFTLLRAVGEPVINQVVEESLIREALEYLFTL